MVTLLEENYDEELKQEVVKDFKILEKEISNFELKTLLKGPYDKNDVILEVHSGAGGIEACDWASMLLRMYLKWCFNHNYQVEVVDTQKEDEAGIKSASLLIKGLYAYGYLKSEKGIYRLIRLSPFDTGKRRHTSFASIEVIPSIEKTKEFDLKDSDLKIDVYKSSGAGGQSVNTTDSAVRITHLPTNITVTCQNERSQIKNKEKALQILKSKIFKLKEEELEKSLSKIKGLTKEIDFGSQIRTYTLHPYKLIKDHRTGLEIGNIQKVFDGEIDLFIEAYLKGVPNHDEGSK